MSHENYSPLNFRDKDSLWCVWCAEVRAALVDCIANKLGKPATSLPMLSDQQLWEGFCAAVKGEDLAMATPAMVNLSDGERFAISLGVSRSTNHLPVGGCFGEIYESAGVDIFGEVAECRRKLANNE